MPTHIVKAGITIPLQAQAFGVDANKAVNGGTFQFLVDGVAAGDPLTANTVGGATLNYAFQTAGTHTVTASYLGGGTIAGVTDTAAPSEANDTVTVTVDDAPTVVNVVQPTTMPKTGVLAAISAKVTTQTGEGLPNRTGAKMNFYDGDTLIGSTAVFSADGTANANVTFLYSGTRMVTAKFLGTTGYAPSTSVAVPVEVEHKDLATSITPLVPSSGAAGVPVTLSAAVSGAIPVDGQVQFLSDGAPIEDPAPLTNGVATTSHIFPEAGSHTITAVFTGTGFVSSTSAPAPLSISEPQPGDTTTTVSAPAATVPAAPVTLTATVAPVPYGGTVQFFVGDTPISDQIPLVNGYAATTHTFAEAGTFQVTARYSGHIAASPSTSAAATVNVVAPTGDTGSLQLLPLLGINLPFGS